MNARLFRRLLACTAWSIVLARPGIGQPPTFNAPKTYQPSEAELEKIRAGTEELAKLLEQIRQRPPLDPGHPTDAYADVAIYHKAAVWVVRHHEFFKPEDVGFTLQAIETGRTRAGQLLEGKRPWADAKGSQLRGFVSRIDGSVQPFEVIVPEKPPEGEEGRYRLDVVLHGRDSLLSEVRFIRNHDGKPAKSDETGLVLHVFGRGNNAYRWAGETDVFEAIDAVKRSFPVDQRRIVLRGFSMGGAGAWHLGLHHPAHWCAVEAGAGFTDTKGYLGKPDGWPAYQEKALHIYDAVDYALNAFDVPMAGYGGELDKQLRASTNIREALEKLGFTMKTEGLVTRGEGLDFLHVVGAKTEHKVDPASATILKGFRDEHAAAGIPEAVKPIRFVTYTLKYNRAAWITVERLQEHYAKTTVEATPDADGEVVTVRPENVAVLGVDRRAGETVRLGEQEFPLRSAVGGLLPLVYFRKVEDRWEQLDYEQSRQLQENARHVKAPGLQGPIDDAFTGPFLCVRGTGRPWNSRVQEWADARLNRFAEVWSKSLRADLPIRDDTAVTPDDIERCHLVLFGDPGSNLLIERARKDLPLSWTREEVRLSGTFPAPETVPILVTLNPLNPHRYLVLNSGHTFGAEAFAGTNALLYPRLGDFGVVKLTSPEGEVAASGYFDESWKAR